MQFVDFTTEVKPLLVIELAGDNLEKVHTAGPITVEEMSDVLYQCLKDLTYLHEQNVTHRDVKPANILVASRRPLSVKLADFGLARDATELQTFCGTLKYCAPEMFGSQNYSKAVDLWSLGVVVMEYVYGLPQGKLPDSKRLHQVKR